MRKKIDPREVEAKLEAGDDDFSEFFEEGTGKRIRKSTKDPEDASRARKKKKPRKKTRTKPEPEEPKHEPAPKPKQETTTKEVPQMKTKKVTKPTDKQASPFSTALYHARQITTRRPEEEQPRIYAALKTAMDQLTKDDQKKLVFRIRNEYLEDKCQISGLFAAAREAKMRAVAVSAVAVKRTGLTFSGLLEVGIAKIVLGKDNKPHTSYSTGADTLAEAAKILRRQDKIAPAQVLEAYLSRNERERALRQAAQKC